MTSEVIMAIRKNYDLVASEYALKLFDELKHKPMDCKLLERFAANVLGKGEVCEVGCGPGQIARYLRDLGVTVFGVDISPRMVEEARQLNPDIAFSVGDMIRLDSADETLGGIVAFYAIVNIPEWLLPAVFREMFRVLKPDGELLLAFHIGSQILHIDNLLGQQVSLDFIFFSPFTVQHLLGAAGFAVEETIERDPYAEVEYQSRRAYVFARKPRHGSAVGALRDS
jgi:SAM-dependent methyltransferase